MTARRFWTALAVITAVGLGVRFYFVLVGYDYYRINGDALYYHLLAKAFASGHGFVDPGRLYLLHPPVVEPGAAHPPLYALYLAFVTWIGFPGVTAQRLASCLLGTAAIPVLGLVGRRVVSDRVGLITAAIAALYANFWINDGMLLSESMTILTSSLVLLAAYELWRHTSTRTAIWLAVALGVAALNRFETMLLAPLVVLPILFGVWRRRERSVTTLLAYVGIIAAGFVLFLGPWVGYNMTRFAKPVYLSDSTGSALSAAYCHSAYYGYYQGWYGQCRLPVPPGRDASERDPVLVHDALHYARHHLGRLPAVTLMRVGRLWDLYRPRQTLFLNAILEGRTRGASDLAIGGYMFLTPLAIAGVITLRRGRVAIAPVLAPVIVVTIAAAVTFGVLRYRASAEPGLALAAAVALEVVWQSFTGWIRPARSSATLTGPGPGPELGAGSGSGADAEAGADPDVDPTRPAGPVGGTRTAP